MRFQSPSGVLGVSRLINLMNAADRAVMFQSPSGVLGVSRFVGEEVVATFQKAFQSPSGVLGVSRASGQAVQEARTAVVSVPFRGFRGLQAL